MLSVLETWINDKCMVCRDGIHEAEQKVAGYCSENSKSCKSKKYVQCKVRRFYKNTDQGTNWVLHYLLKVLG